MERYPVVVMCMLCADILSGAGSPYAIPRVCTCEATRVVTAPDKGIVQWDRKRYTEAGFTEPEVEWSDTPPASVEHRPDRIRTIDDTIRGYYGN